MASQLLTAKHLLEQLAKIVEVEPDCVVRINGESVSQYSITVHNPLGRFGASQGYVKLAVDKSRSKVLDISVNGRESQPLPMMDYPDFPVSA